MFNKQDPVSRSSNNYLMINYNLIMGSRPTGVKQKRLGLFLRILINNIIMIKDPDGGSRDGA